MDDDGNNEGKALADKIQELSESYRRDAEAAEKHARYQREQGMDSFWLHAEWKIKRQLSNQLANLLSGIAWTIGGKKSENGNGKSGNGDDENEK